MPEPFFWKARNCWYVKGPNRENLKLHPDKTEAFKIWSEMEGGEVRMVDPRRFAVVAEAFLRYSQQENAGNTFTQYRDYLADFCNAYGSERIDTLKPFKVTEWLDGKKNWGSSSRRNAITAIKRCLNWAVEEGMIEVNPLAALKRPSTSKRDVLISNEQYAAMIENVSRRGQRRDTCFRAVLIALNHSGGRPGIVASVCVEDVSADGDRWVFREHKTEWATEKPLVVYLSPCLATLTRIAMSRRESGPLFLNSRGEPWTPNAVRCRMRRMRETLKLPEKVVAYSFRHRYATAALMRGVPIAEVAVLLGHTSVATLMKHYAHLAKAPEHMKAAARKAVS